MPPTPMQAWLSLALGETTLGAGCRLRQDTSHGAANPAMPANRRKCRRDQPGFGEGEGDAAEVCFIEASLGFIAGLFKLWQSAAETGRPAPPASRFKSPLT